MPGLPKRKCAYPGCNVYVVPGQTLCREHERQRKRGVEQRRDKSIKGMYNTSRWHALRAWQLSHNPLCVECLRHGIYTPAHIVDHIRPHKGDVTMFYDSRNLQSLCKRCHDAKTAREDGGFGNT